MTKWYVWVLAALLQVACTAEEPETGDVVYEAERASREAKEKHRAEVYALYDQVVDTTQTPRKKDAQDLLLKAVDFTNTFPKDSDAAPFLMMAVKASKSMDDPQVTIEYLNRLIKQYPDYDQRATCFYLRAFTYDFELERPDEALKAYEAFLAEYPDHPYADQAQARTLTLGLSDVELIRMFEANQEAVDSFGT